MTSCMQVKLRCSYPGEQGFMLDVDLQLPAQGVSVLLGPSGSGKTTVLRALAGLTRAQGRVVIGEQVWQDDAIGQWLPTHRRPIGMVFQDSALWPHLNVQGNLLYGYQRVPANQRRITPDDALQLLGISHLLHRHVSGLSGGERQRVAIARALLTSPALLLMDEPLSALDAARKADVLPYLEALSRTGMPMVYVTHALDEAARLADYLVLLDGGRVQAKGHATELLSQLDTPLTALDDAASVLHTRVVSHELAQGLSQLVIEAADSGSAPLMLWAGACTSSVGESVRVRVLARDVSVSLSRATDSSILNIWPAHIDSIQVQGKTHGQSPASVMLRLRLGDGAHVLARVTQRSVDALNLHVGQQVFVQVKGAALLG